MAGSKFQGEFLTKNVEYFSFFLKTTHFNEKLYLGFEPHFS
jgi:hypothetical protein